MGLNFRFYFTFILLGVVLFSLTAERKVLFNENWKFHRGSLANAEDPKFNDSNWRIVDLPHDWSVEPAPIQHQGITVGPFSKINESGAGGADYGQTLGGEGWYRKVFSIDPKDANKLFTLYFEGVYNQSELYINGKKVNFNHYGYTSYKVDITDYCNAPGVPNIIAVRVLNVGENSRWYAGSGIYRNTWLIKTEKTYIEEWDTYVDASKLEGKKAVVNFSTLVHNQDKYLGRTSLRLKVLSPKGKEVYTNSETIKLTSETPFSSTFTINKPELWSVEMPQLYTCEISLESNNRLLDQITIPFGIRTISFSAQEGFLLNGESVKLKGGCVHHDNGLLGAAAINRAEEKKIELLKENGYNAIRCAHNQVSEYILDVCDRLGMLVIHETFDQWQKNKRVNDYHQYFDAWSDWELASSVRRDRNHPSIIMWSIGNEIEQRADLEGVEIAKRLVNTIQKYDNSRFTTVGANSFWDRRHFDWDVDSYRAFENVDVAGYNYVWDKYESDHIAYPERVIYGSESYPKEAAQNWNLVEKHSYVIGDFVWTAIDYLGEAGLGHARQLNQGERSSHFMGWPWYNAWCGDIDFIGEKKPQSYYRDIIWREREISMAVRAPLDPGKWEYVSGWGWTDELLSWNWPGFEGQPMRVNVYSRSPHVRLYLNDKLIGEKETDKENYTATFEVPYTKGTLRAVSLNKRKEQASVSLSTTGEPAAIRLVADRERIHADKNDLSYVIIEIVDANGVVVPDTDLQVNISVAGAGKIAASGNAAYTDMESFRSLSPRVFRGKALAIIQPDGVAGSIELSVSAEGVTPASIEIITE